MKQITFEALNEYYYNVAPKPYPAKESIPDWFRNMQPYRVTDENPDGKKLLVRNGFSNATFKKCTPMLDALTSGYIFPLWADVQVTDMKEEVPLITWKIRKYDVFELHGPDSTEMTTPTGYHPRVFKYSNPWIPLLPKGYSYLVTQPFGFRDTPFHAIPAIIDDGTTLDIPFPVWVKKGFNGIVERGTPMVQITPFKRESWISNFTHSTDEERHIIMSKGFDGVIKNHYLTNFWKKKEYK